MCRMMATMGVTPASRRPSCSGFRHSSHGDVTLTLTLSSPHERWKIRVSPNGQWAKLFIFFD